MAARTYENFDLLVEAGPEGTYRARVTSTPGGQPGEATFTLPFDSTSLENLMLRLDPGRSGTRRGSGDPRVEVGRELGEGLFESLFAGDVALAWATARDAVQAEGKGLRLRLRLDDAPTLAGLPWELLYDRRSNTFLAQSERTPVVRYLDVRQTLRPLHVGGALHVLAVISAPTDLAELDVEAEWARVQEALHERVAAGTVVLERLPEPTLPALGAWLRRHTVHVLHFVGHGDYNVGQGQGVLYFCDRYGRSVPVTASVLGPYISDHDPLRLVVLNACRSASVGSDDPFAGMAQGLVQQNSSAVIAMQFPITDRAAVTFTGEFYGAVADEYPVDQAVTYARKALFASFGPEWATPTLFMQASDGKVFDGIVAETPVPQPEPAPEPEPEAKPQPTTQPVPPPEPAPQVDRQPEPEPEHEPHPTEPGPITLQPRPRRGLVPMLSVGGGVLAVAAAVTAWQLLGPDDTGDGDGSPGPGPSSPGTGQASPGPSSGATDTSRRAAEPGAALAATFMDTPTLDGERFDWPGMSAVGSEQVVVKTEFTTKVDADWRLGWNDEFLFVFVEVLDRTITQTREDDPWHADQGDSVSFEFGDFLDPSPVEELDPDDRYVIIGPTESEGTIAAVLSPAGATFDTPGVLPDGIGGPVAVRTPTGYNVEAAIPWEALGINDPREAQTYAMNVNVSDAIPSGDRRGEIASLQSNNAKRRTNEAAGRYLWGTLTLQGG